jgi:energy-coupling factor transporter ATP-binding protein EcfA2
MYMRRNDIKNEARETCSWLLKNEDYKTWIQDQGLLWIKGKPGAGKSTLLKYALRQAENQASSNKPLVASFFFHGRGAAIQKTPLGLFRSLLHQILDQIPDSLPGLISTLKKRRETQGEPGKKWNWHAAELRTFLKDAILRVSRTHSIRIYVDALDECGEEAARDLVVFFKSLISQLAPTGAALSICFSCRHYPIANLDHGLTICVEEENGPDITTYVQLQLKHGFQDKFKAREVEKMIVGRASGVFQWAVLVVTTALRLYEQGKNIKTIQKKLQEIPAELEILYREILGKIKEENRSQSLQLIQWICFSQRPLSLMELRYAMVIDTDCSSVQDCRASKDYATTDVEMEKAVKSLSGGLAEVKKYRGRRIAQFIHQSVNSYLLQSGLQELGSPSSSSVIGHAHLRLSRACIKYIAMEEVLSCDIEDRRELQRDFPFLPYAVTNWVWHTKIAEAEKISELDAADLVRLLQGRSDQILLNWAKLYQMINQCGPFPTRSPVIGTNPLDIASGYLLPRVLLAALNSQNYVGVDSEDKNSQTLLCLAGENGHAGGGHGTATF